MFARHWYLAFESLMLSYVVPTHFYFFSSHVSRYLQVVFKALIVLHTMIRNGSTDNVLAYLSSSNILRLQNVSSANWEGARNDITVQFPFV